MPRIIPSDAPYPRATLYWDGAAWRGVPRATGVQGGVNAPTAAWRVVVTYTVPAGRMLTVISWGCGLVDTGVEFIANLEVAGAVIMAVDSDGTPVIVPTGVWAPATAGQVVRVMGYHLAAANKDMGAWIRFIEEDAE